MDSIPRHLIDLFAAARIGYTNARDNAQAQSVLADYGYDPVRLDAMLAEVEAAEEAAKGQNDEYDAKELATQALRARFAALRMLYVKHVKLARAVFEEGSKGWRALGLAGERPRATGRLLTQADSFYRALTLDPALLAESSTVTIDQATVDAQRAEVEAVRAELATRTNAKGEAEVATDARDEAAGEVMAAWSRFRRIARPALEDHPQLLEVLGLKDPS